MKLLLSVLCMLGTYSVAQEAKPDVVQRRILALESAWSQAQAEKDASALEILLAPDAMFVDYDGSLINREIFLKTMQAPSQSISRIVNEPMFVRSFGNIALVNGTYRKTGVKGGKHYTLRARFIDIWIQHGEKWTCISSQSTLISHDQLP